MLADVLMLVVALQALGGVEIKEKRSRQSWRTIGSVYLGYTCTWKDLLINTMISEI